MELARAWLHAIGQGDRSAVVALTAFPLLVEMPMLKQGADCPVDERGFYRIRADDVRAAQPAIECLLTELGPWFHADPEIPAANVTPDDASNIEPALRELPQHHAATYLKFVPYEITGDFFMVGVQSDKVFAFVQSFSGLE